ncbi:MAG: hypothetical protein ABI771_10730 [Betaproteobacteria bacterium]
MKKKESWFYLMAFLTGTLVWIVICAISGKKEAWDSSWYFSVGYPLICLVSAVMGYLVPKMTWRWGVMPFVGQLVWLVLTQAPGNLLPLGIIAFGLMSLPAIIVANVGAYVARLRAEGDEL